MSRRSQLAALVTLALLATSIASPALGGPSLKSIAKRANKALSTAKAANSRAIDAKQTANQALARPVVSMGGITTISASFAIPVSYFTAGAAVCPAGQRAISGGASAITGAGALWLNRASDNRAGWIAGGDDFGSIGGTLTVYAYCAPIGKATTAASDRAALLREVEREQRAYATKRQRP